MAFSNETFSSQQLLNARDHVWNQIFSFIKSMSLNCAIQLGIFDIIHKHGKPITLSELIHALPINTQKSHGVDRLMRILINSKFAVKVSDGQEEGYWLTPASRLLVREDPMSIEPFVAAMLDPLVLETWNHLGEWFKDDSSTLYVRTYGKSFWELAGNDQRLNQSFNEGMASDSRFVASVVASECKHVFQGLKSVVDLGGGTGTMAKVIGAEFPSLKWIVLDLPHVVAGLEETDNLTFVGGDMFHSIPHADAVFIKWILHGWSDEDCIKILAKCKEAIPEKENGGKVIIIEMAVADDAETAKSESSETQILFDVLMMTVAGKERTEKHWREIFLVAGFTSYKITPCFGARSLIEIFP